MTRRTLTLVATPCIALIGLASHFASGDQPVPAAPGTSATVAKPMTNEQRVAIEAQNAANNPAARLAPVTETKDAPVLETPVQQSQPQVTVQPQQQPVAPGGNNGGSAEEGEDPTPRAPILSTRRLSYQAVLTDNLGNALPGPTVNLAFRIYSTAPALVEGPINVLNVPIINGVVSTLFDVSASSFDGADRLLGVSVNGGAELLPRIPFTAVPYALRVDRVASEELDDSIILGRAAAPLANGALSIQNGAMAQASIELNGGGHRISTYGSDGAEQIRLWGPSWAEILLNDETGNNTTLFLSATSNSGGLVQVRDATGGNSLALNGGSGRADAEDGYYLNTNVGGVGVDTGRLITEAAGGRLYLDDETGTQAVWMGAAASAGGFLQLYQSNGTSLGMNVDGDANGAGGGGVLNIYGANGSSRITLDGDATSANGGAVITANQADGSIGVTIDGDFDNADGGGSINVCDAVSATRVQLRGESTGTGGEISTFDDDGTETVEILGAETSTTGGQIVIRSADGVSQIELDGEFGVAGDSGRIITPVLQITGGSDLSEQFDISGDFEPGMVVCIDEHNPGKLLKSTTAYDAKVAGVVAGAGGVRPGLLMGQRNKDEVDGKNSVALTGRVYCWVDASFGEIKPGDMLTTSATAGHAMKVSDHSKANGAVIGKAMQPLKSGKGLILVLVNLQ